MQRPARKWYFDLNPQMRVAGPNRPIGRKVTTGPPWWAAARCQLAKKQPGELLHGRPQRPFPPGVSGRTGGEAQNGHTSVHSSVDSAGKQLRVIALSLRRRFVPTAWLLCGLPLSLSFRMNATLACNATQSRKLKVPNLNSATPRSEMVLRSESANARCWPKPPHRSKGYNWATVVGRS